MGVAHVNSSHRVAVQLLLSPGAWVPSWFPLLTSEASVPSSQPEFLGDKLWSELRDCQEPAWGPGGWAALTARVS